MTVKEIQEEMLKNISDDFDKYEGGFTYEIVKSTAIQFEKHEQKNADVLEKMNIENLTGDELKRFVYQRTGLIRRAATFASTLVTITGAPLSKLSVGDLVAADGIFYVVTESMALDAKGFASVPIRCQSAGIIGNVPANTIVSFPVTLSGITSVTNPTALTNGYEEESDASLIERYYEKLQKPGKAGNAFHYLEWARSVAGVGKVKVFPLWNGALTVKVSILDTNTGIATQGLIDSVADYIETQRPFGAIVTISTGTEKPVNISVNISVEENYTVDDVAPLLSKKVSDYLQSLSYVSDYISFAQIGREILSIPEILDYQNLLLNGDTVNVPLESESVPVLGEVSFT